MQYQKEPAELGIDDLYNRKVIGSMACVYS